MDCWLMSLPFALSLLPVFHPLYLCECIFSETTDQKGSITFLVPYKKLMGCQGPSADCWKTVDLDKSGSFLFKRIKALNDV